MPNIKELDSPYELRPAQIKFYRDNGYVKLKQVFAPEVLEHFRQEFARRVQELNTQTLPMAERSLYDKAFVQVWNLWTHSEVAKRFVMGKRLGRIAAELMGCKGVRMFHDQALYKEPGGGFTPWHADQQYWPFESDKTITAWIPFQATPLEMGPLAFAPGSARIKTGRDLEISEESEVLIRKTLRDFPIDETPFDIGEVSFHSGWVFHRAGANATDRCREVMTVIYMDKDMRLSAPKNNNQQIDWDMWCPGVKIGAICDSPLNPVIFE